MSVYTHAEHAVAEQRSVRGVRSDTGEAQSVRVPSPDVKNFYLELNRAYELADQRELVYLVAGEPFRLDIGPKRIALSHQQWPLCGEGTSLIEAEQDLTQNARKLLPTLKATEIALHTFIISVV